MLFKILNISLYIITSLKLNLDILYFKIFLSIAMEKISSSLNLFNLNNKGGCIGNKFL